MEDVNESKRRRIFHVHSHYQLTREFSPLKDTYVDQIECVQDNVQDKEDAEFSNTITCLAGKFIWLYDWLAKYQGKICSFNALMIMSCYINVCVISNQFTQHSNI